VGVARAVGMTASVLLHALLVLMFLPSGKGVPPPPVPVQAQMGEDMDMTLMAGSDTTGDGLACPSEYRGIGIRHYGGTIMEVVAGGPADKAGAQVGDVFLNDATFQRDQYELGKVMVMKLARGRDLLSLTVVIGRICFTR